MKEEGERERDFQVLGRRNGKCKGPEVGTGRAFWKNSEEDGVCEAERARGEEQG